MSSRCHPKASKPVFVYTSVVRNTTTLLFEGTKDQHRGKCSQNRSHFWAGNHTGLQRGIDRPDPSAVAGLSVQSHRTWLFGMSQYDPRVSIYLIFCPDYSGSLWIRTFWYISLKSNPSPNQYPNRSTCPLFILSRPSSGKR
jgi:hypothetical protein